MDTRQFYELLLKHTKTDHYIDLHRKLIQADVKVSEKTIRNWRDEKVSPTLGTMCLICKAVGLQITITPKRPKQ